MPGSSSPSPSAGPAHSWTDAARAWAMLWAGRWSMGWGAAPAAESLALDGVVWWLWFLVGTMVLPRRPDLWIRVQMVLAMSAVTFLSLVGQSLREALAGALVCAGVQLVVLGRHAGSPGWLGISVGLWVPLVCVVVARGPLPGMWAALILTAAVLALSTWRLRLGLFVAFAATILGAPSAAPRWRSDLPPAGDQPDIVLIVADTLRADAASDMRFVERLRRLGGVELQGGSTAPWTLPAMTSLMTGLAPDQHGAGFGDSPLSRAQPGVRMLAAQLGDEGFDTAAVLAENSWLSRRFGLLDGFAEVRGARGAHAELLMRLDTRSLRLLSRVLRDLGVPSRLWGRSFSVQDAAVTARQLMEARRDRPLFLWVHLMDAHMPWEDVQGPAGHLRKEWVLAEPEWRSQPMLLREAYDLQVDALDVGLLALLDALGPPPARGRVLVFTSDHGEEFFEHGGFEHGHALWEELLAVPLVVQGLAVHPTAAGQRIDHLDVSATIRAVAGVERVGVGRPITGPVAARPQRSMGLLVGSRPDAWAVYDGTYKMMDHERLSLFDLATDPEERRDVSGRHPDYIRELQRLRPSRAVQGDPVDPSASERARLRALGYQLAEEDSP